MTPAEIRPAVAPDGFDVRLFDTLAALEPRSFWFRARNRLVVSMLRRHFPSASSFLEIGCGTGFVLAGVRSAFPDLHLVGSDLLPQALETARARLPGVDLRQLDARDIDFTEEFDVVGAFDVLEHIDRDEQALAAMARAVRPGGGILLLVPQHPRLWSEFDAFSRHQRRYTRDELAGKVAGAGLEVVFTSGFVASLLPAMVLARLVRRLRRAHSESFGEFRPGALNAPFERVLDGERWLIERGVSLPFGGSLLMVARKPSRA